MPPWTTSRRDVLRGAAALMADAIVPRRTYAERERAGVETRAIVVTFGGGVRWEDTFAPEGWSNNPHLVSDLVPQGLFYPETRYDGLTGHFNATGALVTGCLQNVDAYGNESPTTPTVLECFRKEPLVLVNFWDIDIAHFGAYSLYLEAIRRTDRLVHGLWEHAQSLPQYRRRTTLIVVPEMGRDGDPSGNGFANHRSGDESCRRLWLLAVGAGVPRGLVSERPIRTTDVAPTLARVLGFKMPEGEGRALSELAF